MFYKNRLLIVLKLVVSLIIVVIVTRAFFIDCCEPYYTIKDYTYQNEFSPVQARAIEANEISQHFIARGNIITNISLHLLGGVVKTY